MRKLGRVLMRLIAGGALLLVLFHGIENWRGKRAWENWKRSREAMGDCYDWQAFVPPAVPEKENFAAAPLVAKAVRAKGSEPLLGAFGIPEDPAPAGTWREGQHVDLSAWAAAFKIQDLEKHLSLVAQELDELAVASRRPKCRFPAKYECAEVSELLGFRHAGRALRLRALLRLSQGRGSEAREDVLTILYMARHLNQEPTLLGMIQQMALVELALQPVWEGLVDRVWQEQDLVQLQAEIGKVDVLRSLSRAWSQERLSVTDHSGTTLGEFAEASGWERARGLTKMIAGGKKTRFASLRIFAAWCLIPRGWVYQNMVHQDRIWAEGLEPCLDVPRRRIYPERSERFRRELKDLETTGRKSPYRFLAALSIPSVDTHAFNMRAASLQSALDQAAVACALERHRIATGFYPKTLEALVRNHMAEIPRDVIDGNPLRFGLNEEGTYVLYSLGANNRDDGGALVLKPEGPPRQDLGKGDWCWPKPSVSGRCYRK